MQLELFGNLTSRRYWIAKGKAVAILGTERDLAAWLAMSRNARCYNVTARDFSLVAATEDDLERNGYKVFTFWLNRESVRHPVFVAPSRKPKAQKAKLQSLEIFDW